MNKEKEEKVLDDYGVRVLRDDKFPMRKHKLKEVLNGKAL